MDELLQTSDMILTDKCAVHNSQFWSNSTAIFFLQKQCCFFPFWLFTLYTVPGKQKKQTSTQSFLYYPYMVLVKFLHNFVKSTLHKTRIAVVLRPLTFKVLNEKTKTCQVLISLLLPIQQTIQLRKNKPQKLRVYTTDRVLLQLIPR